jgi:hypothetical protein
MAPKELGSLPDGFINLATARNSTSSAPVNIIGLVVDRREPKQARGTGDHVFTFKLADASISLSDMGGQYGEGRWDGFTVRCFRGSGSLHMMPQTARIGDAVLLRGIGLTTWNNKVLAMSNAKSSLKFLTFPSESIPSPTYQVNIMGGKQKLSGEGSPGQLEVLTLAEQAYIIKLKHDLAEQIKSRQLGNELPPGTASGPSSAVKRTNPNDLGGNSADATPTKRPRHTGGFGPKFRLIRDTTFPPCWTDLCGEVIKSFPNSWGCDLYISDYTSNKHMRKYPEPDEAEDDGAGSGREGDYFNYAGVPTKRWPGPWGYNILKVNVKEPHAGYIASNVKIGDFVELQNVKMRQAPDNFLEADMWPDHLDTSRIQIRKLYPGATLVKKLQERRDEYWSTREKLLDARRDKDSTRNDKDTSTTTLSKTEKKRLKRQKQREKEQAAKALATGSNSIGLELTKTTKSNINAHIRCSHDDVPVLSLHKILDPNNIRHSSTIKSNDAEDRKITLPFINAKYRSRVRVVDYAPRQLEDFAVWVNSDDENASDDEDDYEPPSPPPGSEARSHSPRRGRGRWEWRFALQLEDSPMFPRTKKKDKEKTPDEPDQTVGDGDGEEEEKEDRIWVQLHHEHAMFLFGRDVDDPEDLRENSRLRGRLREKLFILWGDLEEVKGKGKEAEKKTGNEGKMDDGEAMAVDSFRLADKMEPVVAGGGDVVDTTTAVAAGGRESRSLPFECCLMEYGVQMDEDLGNGESVGEEEGFGWERMFALFGTTIL